MTPREAILEITRDKFSKLVRLARVVPGSVIAGTCTVVPFDTEDEVGVGVEMEGVRLQGEAGTNGMLLIPAGNSTVIISEIDPFEYCIIMYSELDSIQMLDGSLGGLTKSIELKTQLDKTNAVLTAIKNALTTWTPVGGDGGAALKAAVIATLGSLTVGDYSNIQNSNITHGAP